MIKNTIVITNFKCVIVIIILFLSSVICLIYFGITNYKIVYYELESCMYYKVLET